MTKAQQRPSIVESRASNRRVRELAKCQSHVFELDQESRADGDLVLFAHFVAW